MDAKVRKLNRKKDYGTVQGDPEIRYQQDGMFYDVYGEFVRPDPNAVGHGRVIAETSRSAERADAILERARRLMGDTTPLGGRSPERENEAARRAEELSEDA